MKKINKIFFIIALIFILFLSILTKSYAIDDPSIYNPGPIEDEDTGDVGEITNKVLGFIITFGVIFAVIGLIIIGIKLMYGGLEEKAEYKQKLLPYLIGFAVLILIPTIVAIVFNFAQNIDK